MKPPYKTPENIKAWKQSERQIGDLQKSTKAPIVFGEDLSNPACRTPWPRLGRIPYHALFEERIFDENIVAACEGGLDVRIYCAGNPALQTLARVYKLPLSKIGCTQVDLQVRQSQLSRDHYGSGHRRGEDHVFDDEAWSKWEMQTAELLAAPSASSPVSLTSRGLRVRLPAVMTARDFEKSLHRAMARSALHNFARSPAGLEHFVHLGVEPATVPRYVRYRFGSDERISLASEIYICRPREDWTRLKIIAEYLVADFVTRQITQAA